jgi:sugar lactone lactonase YvrE
MKAQTFSNGQDASFVLGEVDFTSSAGSTISSDSTFGGATGSTAIDTVNNKLYVSLGFPGNKILRFSLPITTNQQKAEAVLGQSNFSNSTHDVAINRVSGPEGICVGAGGRLWVADAGNHRVLRFDAAHLKINGANADGVLGQSNFTAKSPGTTQSAMGFPVGVFEDDNGVLWVVEQSNNRVLRFDNAASKGNGANADGVLGHANFTASLGGIAQNSLSFPEAITGNSTGSIWVLDGANRVLRFDNAASKGNGANADGVLGQSNYTDNALGTGQNTFNAPKCLGIDNQGTLYVLDKNNKRILIFNDAASKGNGANADGVLGAPTFTSSGAGGRTQSTFEGGGNGSIAVHGTVLYVPDETNRRVLVFDSTAAVATTIPTVGEWAMIILTLSLFCVAVMYVRKPVLVGAGGRGEHLGSPVQALSVQNMYLNKEDFVFSAKWFFLLSFVVTACVWSACVYFHETAMRDMVGTACTGIIGGYLLQLLVLWYFDEAQ